MKLKKLICIVMISVLGVLSFAGCAKKQDEKKTETSSEASTQEASAQVFAMDTYMNLKAYGKNAQKAVDDAKSEIERLDQLWSAVDKNSEIYQLNQKKKMKISDETLELIEFAKKKSKESNDAFDISIYPIVELWGFPTQNFRVPSQEALDQLLPLTDAGNISYDKATKKISFGAEGMKIDLGGIAKGYTSSRIMDIYKDNGITSGLVNLGGNVQALGTKTDGTKWKIAVQSPDDTEDYLGILSLQDKAVITSGGYERYFEQDGVTYHHIIDPKTGYPAESGLVSVTIVSKDGTLADGLSTSLFIMGEEKAADFWRKHKDDFDAILMSDDGTLYVTEGLENDFSTERTVEIIR